MLIFAEITRPPNMATININTSLGDIKVRLYDETPIHRDNFLKLAQEGFYNGTLFHLAIPCQPKLLQACITSVVQ